MTPARDLTEDVVAGFASRHARLPSHVARAPGRVNLIGEHTDYNAGLCLPIALPHGTWAAVAERPDDRLLVTSAQQEDGPAPLPLATLRPGAVTGWVAYVAGVVWALRESGWAVPGLDVHVASTVPLGSGLSSSAALECSVGAAIAALLGHDLTDGVRRELVAAGIRAETEMAGAPTGGLDQTIAMLGRAGSALLLDFRDGTTRPIPFEPAAAGLALVVVDTRVAHRLVDGGYAARRADCEEAARRLGVASLREAGDLSALTDDRLRRRARHVVSEIGRVTDTVGALTTGDWAEVGRLFLASHASLRDDYEVSCPELDTVVETALTAGAVGARMTGGGFGGSAIVLAPVEAVSSLVAAVEAAFARRGFRAPRWLPATAADGARCVIPPQEA